MGETVHLNEKSPAVLPSYLRALWGRRPGLKPGLTVPRIEARLASARPDPRLVARYRRLCGFVDGPHLPPALPQVLAGGLHLQVLTDPAFPLPVLGVVHVRNVIELHRPIAVAEPLALASYVEGHREVALGIEIDLVTEARVEGLGGDGELVWRSVTTALKRGGPAAAKDKKPRTETPTTLPAERSLLLRVPEDVGRRYSALTGDWNPIHLHATVAKAFGFPRAIAHGMWSLARCLAEAADDVPPGPVRIDVAFKRPVLLPGTVVVETRREAGAVHFGMRSRDGAKVHLLGTIAPLR